jgi:hypoxanthine phosphoribosyltransferase
LVVDALTWHAIAVPEPTAADPYPGDIKSVLLSEAEVQARVSELGAAVGAHYGESIGEGGEDLLLVTVLKGAVMFVTDLARAIPLPTQLEFMAVSSYGSSTSSSGVVRILKDLDRDINDRDVLIVEDIVDSGLTLKWLLRNLATRHPRSLKVCTLLRKPDAVRVDLDIDWCGFDIPNEFVVGYGLDYAERYRDLPYIGTLDPKIYENP